jgi:uncharacterized membrane protein YgcG
MPDSLLPPGWGFAPFDERDLDAVLSGKTADVPVALRPVADVLASLRAGPVPAELYGEANAMAEFRALGLGQAGRPAPTMLLEALPAGSRARSGRQPARHRVRQARRHPPRRATLRPAVLSALAAAAVIVVAVLVTGNFAGPLRDIAHMASPSAGASFPKGPTGHSAPRVDTTSAGHETTAATSAAHSSAPAQSPSQTCRAYYTSLVRPQGPSAWATRLTLLQQLTKLARTHNPSQVYQYCARYVEDLFPAETPGAGPDQAPTHTGPGSQDNGNLGQQAGAPANSRNGSGSGQASSGQASNGQASSGQASSGQGDPPGSGSNP